MSTCESTDAKQFHQRVARWVGVAERHKLGLIERVCRFDDCVDCNAVLFKLFGEYVGIGLFTGRVNDGDG